MNANAMSEPGSGAAGSDEPSEPRAEPRLDPERQCQAKRYAAQKRALLVADGVLGLSYLLAWQIGLDLARARLFGPLPVALLFLALLAGYEVVTLPFSWLSYALARGYGLSRQGPRGWLWDKVKALLLTADAGGALVEIAYLLMGALPAWWWLALAGIIMLFTVLLANLAPVLIVPLFFKLTPLANPELEARLLDLARRAGTNVRGVFTLHLSEKTSAANAAVMGWGNTRRIVVGDTLTASFTADETEAVLAHELGHQVHHDIWKAMLVQAVVVLLALWLLAMAYGLLSSRQFLAALPDAATMPALALLFALFSALFVPLVNWTSRVAERRADEYALAMATQPRAFAFSMIRLANQNLAEVDPPRWAEFLLYDHPAINRRIALFEETSGRR
ncbi:MAG: M48 family metalloprotease [Chloroflexota bacterium]